MTDLRHPALRYRDVNRITDRRLIDVQWEPGVDAKNEWVLASLEDEEHRRRLLAWLDGEKSHLTLMLFCFTPAKANSSWSFGAKSSPPRSVSSLIGNSASSARISIGCLSIGRKAQRDLVDGPRKRANKSPEPTVTAVTPRAIDMYFDMKLSNLMRTKARVAPAATVAHL